MNPDSDATAIWLERKFDVPASGWWESDTVFSIPLSRNNASSSLGFPGLIIFECTPLEGVTDDLERFVCLTCLSRHTLTSEQEISHSR